MLSQPSVRPESQLGRERQVRCPWSFRVWWNYKGEPMCMPTLLACCLARVFRRQRPFERKPTSTKEMERALVQSYARLQRSSGKPTNREKPLIDQNPAHSTDVDDSGRIGLALSGGGFRATLFHLGTTWRLNELGLLPRLDTISSVSGGSILSGLMAVRWSRLSFDEEVATNFYEIVVEPIWKFCNRNVDVLAAVSNVLPRVNLLSFQYERGLVGKHTLQDIPDSPEFVFNAAHLDTGRNWTFSKSRMRTYRLGSVERPEVRLSDVIAASSSFPLFFAPVVITVDPKDFQRTQFADLFDRTDLKKSVSLADGGLYDNLGIHAIRDFGTLLVSDASSPLEARRRVGPIGRFLQRTKRPIDIAVEQSRALRRQDLVGQLEDGEKRGALWTIRTPPARYPLESPFVVREEWVSRIGAMRTRLNPFSDEEKATLINWGYVQCDLAIRSYYEGDASEPQDLPFPDIRFD